MIAPTLSFKNFRFFDMLKRRAYALLFLLFTLQGRIAEAIDQSVHLAACLAVGALVVVEALVVGQIGGGVDGVDGNTGNLVHCTVDACDTDDVAAVVAGAADAALCGVAGGGAGDQNQNVLVADVMLHVVTEEHLTVGVVLRLQHADGVGVVDGTGVAE